MSRSTDAIRVVFEDQHLIVLSKPAGLLTQGEHTGDENLVDWLRGRLGRPYVGLVHRLDRNTSGLLVVAKRTKAARRLTEALQEGQLERSYQALLVGSLAGPSRWHHWLFKNPERNEVRVVREGTAGAKEAFLKVTPAKVGRWEGLELTLAEFVLETGRSHQIRVQAAANGTPLLGDRKYGGPRTGDFPRPALHSSWIRFPHPMSQETLEFRDPLPADMKAVCDRLRSIGAK